VSSVVLSGINFVFVCVVLSSINFVFVCVFGCLVLYQFCICFCVQLLLSIFFLCNMKTFQHTILLSIFSNVVTNMIFSYIQMINKDMFKNEYPFSLL
jgi:hypothetical protein